jgi:dephospho-CoA kinase
MKNIRVAITGNIGSGKSTFTEYLHLKGYVVINADDVSKELLSSDEEVIQSVVDEFGNDVYTNGKLNKDFLAEKVFSDYVNLDKLNSILHPQVLRKIDSIISKKYSDEKFIFIEAALIYEADIEIMFDYVVLIKSKFEFRLNRTIKKGDIKKEDFQNRNDLQIPDKEKEKRADFIFSNNSSKEELFKKADLLLLTLGLV